MIDRIEELLGSLAAEDEEEREDVPAWPITEGTVLFSPHRDEGEAGDGGTEGGGGAVSGVRRAQRALGGQYRL